MTGKRFNIKPSAIVDDVTVIIDNQKEYTFPVLDSTLNYMFYKVLNEQHETIQRLKQNIDELLSVDVEEDLLKENEQLKGDVYDWKASAEDYLKLGKSLKKENEQLKQSIKEIDDAELHLKQIILKRIDDYIWEWEDEGTPVAQVLKELQNEIKGGDVE